MIAIVAGLLTVAFRKNRAEVRYWLWFSASFKSQAANPSDPDRVFPAFAFRSAREHGIAVDEQAAHADAAAAFGFYSNFERAVEYTHIIDRASQPGHRFC
jgi:hypothetical protein